MVSPARPANASSDQRRAHLGAPLFLHGFRPFFLGGAIWAAIVTPLWVMAFSGHHAIPFAIDAFDWHRHEMIWGWLSAVVAGFLLTAVPNWTGRLPVVGDRLMALVGLWLAGRLALALAGPAAVWVSAPVAALFPLTLAAFIWREVLSGGGKKNIPVAVLITLYAVGDVVFLLGALGLADVTAVGSRLGMGAIMALIALIGGRVTPSFTRNWLAKARSQTLPPEFDKVDQRAMIVTIVSLVAWLIAPDFMGTGVLLMAGGAATALRLSRWRGLATFAEPLVTVLHAGYGFLALGLFLTGLSVLVPGVIAGLHAATVGGFGLMTLAIMTRATLGHTGRDLTASKATVTIYALVALAAVVRVLAPVSMAAYTPMIHASALLWTAGYGLYVVIYGRMLLTRRADGG